MCATCGCDTDSTATIHGVHGRHSHVHHHSHDDHTHLHETHGHPHPKKVVEIEQDVLHQNNLLAERNRGYFHAKNILAINLVSSPGSGKTTLLETTLHQLKDYINCSVIEGDQQTANDADRIHATGTSVVQVNTGKGCHLDAHIVFHALEHLAPKDGSIVFIENVGNLVCPAMFDLGEALRVVIASVTEGDDKPLKYPDMFCSSQLCIINKTDLLPYVPFDVEKFKNNASKVNPRLHCIEVSALKGDGMNEWYQWLTSKVKLPETTSP